MEAQGAGYKAQGLFPVLCSWCEREGRRTVIRWVDYPHSHGICDRHAEEVRREIENLRAVRRDIERDLKLLDIIKVVKG